MHQAVDRSCSRHRILEDCFPLRKWEIARDHDTTPLVPLGQKGEQHFLLLSALLHVAQVVDDRGSGAGRVGDRATVRVGQAGAGPRRWVGGG